MATKRSRGGARPTTKAELPPPAPGAEWGDEQEFERFWGKTPDGAVEEFRREDAASPPRRVLTEAEFLASLEERP